METTEAPPPFVHRAPRGPETPFLFSVPHSGRFYPPDFMKRSRLSKTDLRLAEDAFVDTLMADMPAHGVTMLVATHARSYLDLNRAAYELDTEMFTPPLASQNHDTSYRVQAGLGVIPRLIAEGMPIYAAPLPAREAEKRITTVHAAYHQKLAQLLAAKRAQFPNVFLVDCHSMPSGSHLKSKRAEPDIILGDCWGKSCMRDFTSLAEQLFSETGLKVRRNVPYSGGYTTENYGKPETGVHALQIEINRALYMDEETYSPLPAFDAVKTALGKICAKLVIETLRNPITMANMQQAKAAE
ncbi:N-formylglutamate amidohydrolase [Kordiimonas pumila]|uniref:N-formylglutamate amidohydrolase n=1 Tax=Kordiimonas pumila TaxID=2161677 RepID=A0ABV7D6L5_9PROT|nr:N-formylglutamate amidohydrolase [Kordiimonas pumila]